MKRRDFLHAGVLSTLAGAIYSPVLFAGGAVHKKQNIRGKAKNIILLVSDGMSNGTLTMADLLLQRKESRVSQEEIASMYLPLRFDVMMGGGFEFFSHSKRKDGNDLFEQYRNQDYQVALTKEEMDKAIPGKPLLGVFFEDGLTTFQISIYYLYLLIMLN